MRPYACSYTVQVDESDSRKLDAIVGAAIKALAESGAADEFVGSFAASHRGKVARILGLAAPEPEQAPDLVAIVTKAVEDAMAKLAVPAKEGSRAPRARRVYVTVAGRKTSVTLAEASIDKLVASAGDRRKAMGVIQQLAARAPADVPNRSKWVEQHMLLVGANSPQATSRH